MLKNFHLIFKGVLADDLLTNINPTQIMITNYHTHHIVTTFNFFFTFVIHKYVFNYST